MAKSFYLFDWVSFTTQAASPKCIKDVYLCLEDVTMQGLRGMYGYKDRLYYNGISIHYNGRPDMGVWCEMSGMGCRTFETYGDGDYEGLFSTLLENGDNITRLDVAFDEHEGLLDMEQLLQDTRDENFVSRFRSHTCTFGSGGISVVHGRRGSKTMIRIYDKAAEQKISDRQWVRIEMQFRDDRAKQFVLEYMADSDMSRLFCGVLNQYLRYVAPNDSDDNKWRWPMVDYWSALLERVDAIKLFLKPGVDYNLGKLENYLGRQAGNAIEAYIDIKGVEGLVKLIKRIPRAKNPKYELLKEQELHENL